MFLHFLMLRFQSESFSSQRGKGSTEEGAFSWASRYSFSFCIKSRQQALSTGFHCNRLAAIFVTVRGASPRECENFVQSIISLNSVSDCPWIRVIEIDCQRTSCRSDYGFAVLGARQVRLKQKANLLLFLFKRKADSSPLLSILTLHKEANYASTLLCSSQRGLSG